MIRTSSGRGADPDGGKGGRANGSEAVEADQCQDGRRFIVRCRSTRPCVCELAPGPTASTRRARELRKRSKRSRRSRSALDLLPRRCHSCGRRHTEIVEAAIAFAEMVGQVGTSESALDILIATPGGFAHQVGKFVSHVRPRFSHVSFIIPHMAMSAGTIWALSGDEIWMDARGCLGPIDPQVPGKDGRLVPAQALLTFLNQIRREGEESIKQGLRPPWTHVLLVRSIDPKELGNVISQSVYSIDMAAGYLATFKFKSWTSHSDGRPVTPEERVQRAGEIAAKLGSHDQWRLHSHGITRDVLWQQLKLQINHPEAVPELEHAIRRLWAVAFWIFDNTPSARVSFLAVTHCFGQHKEGNDGRASPTARATGLERRACRGAPRDGLPEDSRSRRPPCVVLSGQCGPVHHPGQSGIERRKQPTFSLLTLVRVGSPTLRPCPRASTFDSSHRRRTVQRPERRDFRERPRRRRGVHP